MIISIILVTIGRAITSTIILPAKSILSATLLLPASLQRFAENSVKYPTPIIFKIVFKSPPSIPVLWTIFVKASIISYIES